MNLKKNEFPFNADITHKLPTIYTLLINTIKSFTNLNSSKTRVRYSLTV